jgi:peptidoglycan/LPS O-acetylase OafA/YrhL
MSAFESSCSIDPEAYYFRSQWRSYSVLYAIAQTPSDMLYLQSTWGVGGLPLVFTDLRGAITAAANEQKASGAISQKNYSIQCLRGIAALFVVLYHASFYSEQYFGGFGWQINFFGNFASLGVAIFFVISGLLMANLIQRSDPWKFLAHRVVRIYPSYLVAVAVWLSIDAFLGIHSIGFHLFSLMLVPAGQRDYYLGVEWTLVFECSYYLALFLIALIGWYRYLNRIALFWIAGIAAAPLFIGWNERLLYPIYLIWLAPANVAFIGGLLIPSIARKIRVPVDTGIVALCIVVALGNSIANPMVARWTVGAIATVIVLDIARIDLPRRVLAGAFKLGDWSYALYLCHCPCIWIVYRLWPSHLSAEAAWFAAVATALGVSLGFGVFDVWMYRYLKKGVDSADRKRRERLVNIYASVFLVASAISLVI